MKKNKQKLKSTVKNRAKEKITELRQKISQRKRKHLDKENLMNAAGRLELATFRPECKRVNHCATVTFGNLRAQLSTLVNGSMSH